MTNFNSFDPPYPPQPSKRLTASLVSPGAIVSRRIDGDPWTVQQNLLELLEDLEPGYRIVIRNSREVPRVYP